MSSDNDSYPKESGRWRSAALDEAYSGGPKSWGEAFPPICLRSHWNPTALTNHILPSATFRDLSLDPRPASKICTSYYTSSAGDASIPAPKEFRPQIPAALLNNETTQRVEDAGVVPPGGAAGRGFPYAQFAKNVGKETDLLRINEPLSRCTDRRYMPANGLPAPQMATNRIFGADPSYTTKEMDDKATIVSRTAGCREADDQAAWDRSARLFFNPTRYDRTSMVPNTLRRPESTLACKN
jgi:hypothetical protein